MDIEPESVYGSGDNAGNGIGTQAHRAMLPKFASLQSIRTGSVLYHVPPMQSSVNARVMSVVAFWGSARDASISMHPTMARIPDAAEMRFAVLGDRMSGTINAMASRGIALLAK